MSNAPAPVALTRYQQTMQGRPLLPVYRTSARALYVAILDGIPCGHVHYSSASGNRPEWRCGTCGDDMKRSQQIVRHIRARHLYAYQGGPESLASLPFRYTKYYAYCGTASLGEVLHFEHPIYSLWWFPLTDFTCTTVSEMKHYLLPRLLDATTLQVTYGASWVSLVLPDHL